MGHWNSDLLYVYFLREYLLYVYFAYFAQANRIFSNFHQWLRAGFSWTTLGRRRFCGCRWSPSFDSGGVLWCLTLDCFTQSDCRLSQRNPHVLVGAQKFVDLYRLHPYLLRRRLTGQPLRSTANARVGINQNVLLLPRSFMPSTSYYWLLLFC